MIDEHLLKKQILDSTNDKLIPDCCSEVKSQFLMMKPNALPPLKRKKAMIRLTISSFAAAAITFVLVAFVNHQSSAVPDLGYQFAGKEEALQVSLATVSSVISNDDINLETEELIIQNSSFLNHQMKDETPPQPPEYPWDENGPLPMVEHVFSEINSYVNTSEIILRDQLPIMNPVISDKEEYRYEVLTDSMNFYYNENYDETQYSMRGLIIKDANEYLITGTKDLDNGSDICLSVTMSSTYTLNVTNHSSTNDFVTCDYEIINSLTQITSSYQLVENTEEINDCSKPCVTLLYRPNIAKVYQNDFTFYINDDDQLAGSYTMSFDETAFGDEQWWGVKGNFFSDYDNQGAYRIHGHINQFFQKCPSGGNPEWRPSPNEYAWNMDYGDPQCQGSHCHGPHH
ncbi:MAG: hypothetical protein WC201_03295 [Bacilli bacterium]